ncbi:sensor histidine kinase [Brevibacterium sp. S111]|nr:sensor histidine kinase [Brevibacterium sp. S111]
MVVFVYNLPIQFSSVPEDMWPGLGLLFSVGLCAPYLLRHRRPLTVFVTISLVAAVHLAIGVEMMIADVMVLFALCALSSRFRWHISVPATTAVIIILIFATSAPVNAGYMSVGDVGVLIAITVWTSTWGALVRVRRDHEHTLRERAEQLEREAQVQQQIVAAQERERIARELHDVVSHSLSVVSVLADGAAASVDSQPAKAKTAMEDVRDTGRSALREMRTMLGVLRTDDSADAAPQPGIDQLRQLVAESQTAGFPATLDHRGERSPLPEGLSLAVYRIVQEALTNVRKHAGTQLTEVHVRVDQTSDQVAIRITDNGNSTSANHERQKNGHGLVGMRERVSAYDGTLHAGFRRHHGFEVHAVLPIGGRRS